jgi:hypothetical protein
MNNPPKYNTETVLIEYNDNFTYRNTVRSLFGMNSNKTDIENQYDTIDNETLDELDYDDDLMTKIMNDLFVITKDNVLFQSLYDLAAAKLFSVDRQLGQGILFSYDYLYLFHACMCVFLCAPDEFTDMCIYYIDLKRILLHRNTR